MKVIRPLVLYIEDNASFAPMVQIVLERKLSVTVLIAKDVGEAERALNTHCFDLVISDVNIPGALGTEIIREILARDSSQPAMILTAYVGDEIRHEASRLGVPVVDKYQMGDSETFARLVADLLTRRPCPDDAMASGDGDGIELQRAPITRLSLGSRGSYARLIAGVH